VKKTLPYFTCCKAPTPTGIPHGLHQHFIGLAYQGKYIVFRFTIEYSSSLRDFGPDIIGLFLYEDFWKMIFWLVLKLEISYRVIIISWRILVSLRGFFEDDIFCKWNIWVSMILLLHCDTFQCKWQGHSMTHPLVSLDNKPLCAWQCLGFKFWCTKILFRV
jgi:hypothetical protein